VKELRTKKTLGGSASKWGNSTRKMADFIDFHRENIGK
jgi:hypothetical protein